MTNDAQTINVTPKKVNLMLYQGDDFSMTVTFPVSVNLTGSTAKMRIQRMDGTTVLTLSMGSGIALAAQVFTATITKIQMAAMTTEVVMLYDFQWTNASSAERTVSQGTIQVEKQITNT